VRGFSTICPLGFLTDLSLSSASGGEACSFGPREPLVEPGEAVTESSHLGQDGA
jgi:hypothetical protein